MAKYSMRTPLSLTVAAVFLAVACQNQPETPAAPPVQQVDTTPSVVTTDLSGASLDTKIDLVPNVLQRAAVGTARNGDGEVVTDTSTLPSKQPVYLTMTFRQSPPELQVSARWLDDKDHEVAVERRAANGEQTVTLGLDKGLPKGKYKVEGYWGGNLVFEREVTVQD